jgi:hypothetical protein
MKRNLKVFSVMFMLVFCMALLGACSTVSNICPAPDGQASVICALSEKMNTSPENLSQILQVANFVALEKSLYTANEASEFIDQIILDLKTAKYEQRGGGPAITYAQALDYVNKKFNVLSAEVQAVFIILNPADLASKEIKIPMIEYDINLLIRHLEKQKQIVQVYM